VKDETPEPDTALARSPAILRERVIPIIENKSTEIRVTFLGPLGADALVGEPSVLAGRGTASPLNRAVG